MRRASSWRERPVRLRAAPNMPPVISTIVMLRLFARRQRASMSAYFTNSLTPPTGLGLLGVAPRRAFSVGQRAARSPERWPAGLPRGIRIPVQGHQLAHSEGAAWSLPLLIGSGDGRQDARPCFAPRPQGATLTFPQFAHAYFRLPNMGQNNGRKYPSGNAPDLRPAGARYLFGRGVPTPADLGIIEGMLFRLRTFAKSWRQD